jgi:hypothetical protein
MPVKPYIKYQVPDFCSAATQFLVATVVGFSSVLLLAPSASASQMLIRTACIDPIQGEGLCEVVFPNEIWANSDESDIAPDAAIDIMWPDRSSTRTRFSDPNTPFNIQFWNSQNNQWVNSTSMGLCWDRECLQFPISQSNAVDQEIYKGPMKCSSPTLREGTCQVESVPETEGWRVDWPDGSIDHFRWADDPDGNESPLKWSHSENDWVKVKAFGICANERCLIFDSPF